MDAIIERKKRYLVQAGSRYLELNPARSQMNGRNEYDTTGSVQFAAVFQTRALAEDAADQERANYQDWPVEVVEDWR